MALGATERPEPEVQAFLANFTRAFEQAITSAQDSGADIKKQCTAVSTVIFRWVQGTVILLGLAREGTTVDQQACSECLSHLCNLLRESGGRHLSPAVFDFLTTNCRSLADSLSRRLQAEIARRTAPPAMASIVPAGTTPEIITCLEQLRQQLGKDWLVLPQLVAAVPLGDSFERHLLQAAYGLAGGGPGFDKVFFKMWLKAACGHLWAQYVKQFQAEMQQPEASDLAAEIAFVSRQDVFLEKVGSVFPFMKLGQPLPLQADSAEFLATCSRLLEEWVDKLPLAQVLLCNSTITRALAGLGTSTKMGWSMESCQRDVLVRFMPFPGTANAPPPVLQVVDNAVTSEELYKLASKSINTPFVEVTLQCRPPLSLNLQQREPPLRRLCKVQLDVHVRETKGPVDPAERLHQFLASAYAKNYEFNEKTFQVDLSVSQEMVLAVTPQLPFFVAKKLAVPLEWAKDKEERSLVWLRFDGAQRTVCLEVTEMELWQYLLKGSELLEMTPDESDLGDFFPEGEESSDVALMAQQLRERMENDELQHLLKRQHQIDGNASMPPPAAAAAAAPTRTTTTEAVRADALLPPAELLMLHEARTGVPSVEPALLATSATASAQQVMVQTVHTVMWDTVEQRTYQQVVPTTVVNHTVEHACDAVGTVFGSMVGAVGGTLAGPAGEVAGGVAGAAGGYEAGDAVGRYMGTETVYRVKTVHEEVVEHHQQTLVNTHVNLTQSLAVAPVAGAALTVVTSLPAMYRGVMTTGEVIADTASAAGRGLAVSVPATGVLTGVQHGMQSSIQAVQHACNLAAANPCPVVNVVASAVNGCIGAVRYRCATTELERSSAKLQMQASAVQSPAYGLTYGALKAVGIGAYAASGGLAASLLVSLPLIYFATRRQASAQKAATAQDAMLQEARKMLGLRSSFTQKEVQARYNLLAKWTHEDHTQGDQEMRLHFEKILWAKRYLDAYLVNSARPAEVQVLLTLPSPVRNTAESRMEQLLRRFKELWPGRCPAAQPEEEQAIELKGPM